MEYGNKIMTALIFLIIAYFIFSTYTNDMKDALVKNADTDMLKLYKKANMSELVNNNRTDEYTNIPYKIAFVTFEDRKDDYIDLHNKNVEKYCKKWSYDYIFTETNKTGISPYWYKLHLVQNALLTDEYDYVFWLDSDVIINKHDISLGEDILKKYASDIFVASDNIKHDVCNSGLFVIKNSEVGRRFMKDWINSFNDFCYKKDNKSMRGKWAMSCYEQGNMNKLIMEKYGPYTTVLENNIFMNGKICRDDVFIMHQYASSSDERYKCFLNK